MSETRHTPGPWEWDQGDVGIDSSQRYCEVFKDGGDLILASVNDFFSPEQGGANARLMAAAPDLLAALELLDERGHTEGVWMQAKRAMAKARGETE